MLLGCYELCGQLLSLVGVWLLLFTLVGCLMRVICVCLIDFVLLHVNSVGVVGNDSFDTGCLIWFSCLLVLVVYLIWVGGLSLPAGLCIGFVLLSFGGGL